MNGKTWWIYLYAGGRAYTLSSVDYILQVTQAGQTQVWPKYQLFLLWAQNHNSNILLLYGPIIWTRIVYGLMIWTQIFNGLILIIWTQNSPVHLWLHGTWPAHGPLVDLGGCLHWQGEWCCCDEDYIILKHTSNQMIFSCWFWTSSLQCFSFTPSSTWATQGLAWRTQRRCKDDQ